LKLGINNFIYCHYLLARLLLQPGKVSLYGLVISVEV